MESLEAAAFEALLARLAPDRAAAAILYEALRARLIRYFRWQRAAAPEDQADDTLNRTARKLNQGEPIESVERYASGVAKLILRESVTRAWRQDNALRQMPAPQPPDLPDPVALQCLNRCLAALDTAQRSLIVAYYSKNAGSNIETRKRMAGELGLERNALRNRVLRLRERLEACVRACLDANRDGIAPGGTKK